MTLKRNTFEGYEVGVAPTVATSGGASGDAFSLTSFPGGSGVIVDTPVLQGARAVRVTVAAGSTSTGLVELSGTPGRMQAASFLYRPVTHPSTDLAVTQARHSGGLIPNGNVTHAANGTYRFGPGTTTFTSPVIPNGVTYRIDQWLEQAATPTTGNGRYQGRIVRVSDGVVVFESPLATAIDLGATLPDRVRFGKTGTAAGCDFYMDTVSYDDALAAYITPPSDFQAPTLQVPTEDPVGTGNLSWGAVPGATGYVLERSLSASSGFAVIATQAGTTYADTGRAASTTYYYRVKATK